MPINAQITENNASSVRGTTTTPSSVAGSTAVGVQPSITRMTIPGIKGADGDITWQGTWSSSTTYTQNNAIQYNGSSYVALQGNTDVRPDTNASVWSLMAQKGDTGATGASGATGETGPRGLQGETGPQGQQGTAGATGQTGATGPQGPQGDAGTAATIQVGSVSASAAGSNPTVTNSGSSTAAVLNFSLPRGATGPQGAQGVTGAAGAQGADGAQGATGPQGPQGNTGNAATIAVGTVSTGLAGSNVIVTNSGSTGAATFDFTIPRGDTGASGSFTWRGGWNSATAYGTNEVVAYNGTSYIAVANNQNVRPDTDTTKWNVMAQAGAEGGSISSMEDTQISGTVSDMAILAYDSNGTKWKDNNTFSGTFASPVLLGGTF